MSTPALLVPILSRNNVYALPPAKPTDGKKPKKAELIEYAPLADALTRRFGMDAHFTAYSMPEIPHRLSVGTLRDPEWCLKFWPTPFASGISMRLAIFDTDCPATHGTKTPAPDEWWFAELKKIKILLALHEGAFVYRTRGGHRIVYQLEEFRVTKETEDLWTMRYAQWIAYLHRVAGIEADVSCADWTRLQRLPHATRDKQDKPEERDTFGDPNNIANWVCVPTEEDVALARKLKKPKDEPKKKKAKSTASHPTPDAGEGILFHAMKARGQLGHEISLNKWAIQCPWESLHTGGATFDTSTVLFGPNEGSIFGFPKCSHAHCQNRTLLDWLPTFSQSEIDAARTAAGIPLAVKPSPPHVNGTSGPVAHLPPSSTEPPAESERDDGDGITANFTDVANAEKFVALHGEDLRFVGKWKRWIFWDGKRWLVDGNENALRYAVLTARAMMKEARVLMDKACDAREAAAATSDEDLIRKAKKKETWASRALDWATKSHSRQRLEAMLAVACADVRVAVSHEQLDSHPWLINVGNGTLDLRDASLRSHLRDDLLTKVAPIDYDATADAPTWASFLDAVMSGDRDLVSYLGRAIGYALTGVIRDHVLVFFHGETGSNGKSTFLQTIHKMLGEYATPAARGLLFRSAGERHPTEIATLHSRRFVTCSEVESGRSFDEGLLKDLTGGDPINARRMREDEWTFRPTHKLFIAGNHKPRVKGTDGGIWRRIHLVPWLVCFENTKDLSLPAKLEAELPGILAWAVEGCLQWQRLGLAPPAGVRDATQGYRDESDPLNEFFELRCKMFEFDTVSRRDLRALYETHCRENGEKFPVSPRQFASKLRSLGVVPTTKREDKNVVPAWRGIRIMTPEEMEIVQVKKIQPPSDHESDTYEQSL